MRYFSLAIVMTAFLAACTPGTEGYNRLLEDQGAVRVEPSNKYGYDYTVYIRNIIDIGYDPSDKLTRDKLAIQLLANQCEGARVVGETTIKTGYFLTGRPAITYLVQVDCH